MRNYFLLALLFSIVFTSSHAQLCLYDTPSKNQVCYILENNTYDLYGSSPCVRARVQALYILKEHKLNDKKTLSYFEEIVKLRNKKHTLALPKYLQKRLGYQYLAEHHDIAKNIMKKYKYIGYLLLPMDAVRKARFDIYSSK